MVERYMSTFFSKEKIHSIPQCHPPISDSIVQQLNGLLTQSVVRLKIWNRILETEVFELECPHKTKTEAPKSGRVLNCIL